jgi:hypothetical protein
MPARLAGVADKVAKTHRKGEGEMNNLTELGIFLLILGAAGVTSGGADSLTDLTALVVGAFLLFFGQEIEVRIRRWRKGKGR